MRPFDSVAPKPLHHAAITKPRTFPQRHRGDPNPAAPNFGARRDFLAHLPDVADVRDLHSWLIGATDTALTCHLVMPGDAPGDGFILDTGASLDSSFAMHHATLQVEMGDAPFAAMMAADFLATM